MGFKKTNECASTSSVCRYVERKIVEGVLIPAYSSGSKTSSNKTVTRSWKSPDGAQSRMYVTRNSINPLTGNAVKVEYCLVVKNGEDAITASGFVSQNGGKSVSKKEEQELRAIAIKAYEDEQVA